MTSRSREPRHPGAMTPGRREPGAGSHDTRELGATAPGSHDTREPGAMTPRSREPRHPGAGSHDTQEPGATAPGSHDTRESSVGRAGFRRRKCRPGDGKSCPTAPRKVNLSGISAGRNSRPQSGPDFGPAETDPLRGRAQMWTPKRPRKNIICDTALAAGRRLPGPWPR